MNRRWRSKAVLVMALAIQGSRVLYSVLQSALLLRVRIAAMAISELLFFLVFIVVVYWRGLVGVRAGEASSRVDTITWDADYHDPRGQAGRGRSVAHAAEKTITA